MTIRRYFQIEYSDELEPMFRNAITPCSPAVKITEMWEGKDFIMHYAFAEDNEPSASAEELDIFG